MRPSATNRLSFCGMGLLLGGFVHLAVAGGVARAAAPFKPDRVEVIARMLRDRPAGFGRPITDRAAWERLAEQRGFATVVGDAEKTAATPIPDQPDELYLEFSRTGNRMHWQDVAAERRGRIRTLVLGECVENKGRFLPALHETIRALCSERTWVMPAHDGKLANFRGERIDIDLASAALAWELAETVHLLVDKLDAEIVQLIRENIDRRIFTPFRDMVEGRRPANWWLTTTNNWNAVCLACVTGSALALIEPASERAFFVAAAEHYSKNFLKGFTPDGYCSEGVGYWNYGFGHYVLLAEAIWQATGGKLDLLALEKAQAPARYGARIEIINNVYPSFADCHVDAKPSPCLMHFLDRRLGLGLAKYRDVDPVSAEYTLYAITMFAFDNSASQRAVPTTTSTGLGLRTWFADGGVLICRPGPIRRSGYHSPCWLGLAAKGGHNAEHHNHNDVGTYIVVVGDRPVLTDPGGEVYTRRTFSAHRYESQVLNSFGHPVPVIAGQLQRTGPDARGRVVRTEFTELADTLVLDLNSAYDVADLTSLQRTFVYKRSGNGSLKVIDEMTSAQPVTFETALVSFGQFERIDDRTLRVQDGPCALRVIIDTEGAPFEIHTQTLIEDMLAKRQPNRLGLRLAEPVVQARVTLTITPAP